MATAVKPVWVWLPGEVEPVQCGMFKWKDGLGEFSYDTDYRDRRGSLPLDPTTLPFTRSPRPHRETKQRGLFGVFRDASPEGYGLTILEGIEKRALDVIDRLEVSLGDGVGAIEVCDDIERKRGFAPVPLSDFLEKLEEMPEGAPVSQVVRGLHGVHGTTLGGERPKMTVMHGGQHWIAKLQDRGDTPNSPLREFLAMRAARAAGIDVCQVEFHRRGQHQAVAVQRFDRVVQGDFQVQRRMFASAHTLLRLDIDSTRGDRQRSYPYLAGELQRWCGADGVDVTLITRELWRRMAFNAIVGNADDHPRNHGVLCTDGRWALSPAYDIAPYIQFSRVLSMAVTRENHSQAARWALLRDCETFGYEEEEANAFIDSAIQNMKESWEAERAAQGFKPEDAPTPQPEIWLESSPPAGLRPKRRKRQSRK